MRRAQGVVAAVALLLATVVRGQEDPDALAASWPPPCSWGGAYNGSYLWAAPRLREEPGPSGRGYYCSNVADFNARKAAALESGKGVGLLVLGDSIMHCLRDDSSIGWCPGVATLFSSTWGTKYNGQSWALRKATTSTLMWRLLNGNGPAGLNTKAVLLLIGTNDLDKADPSPEGQLEMAAIAAERTTIIIHWLLQQDPALRVLVMGLLPRSAAGLGGDPSLPYEPEVAGGIGAYNHLVKTYARAVPRVSFIGCHDNFLAPGGGNLRTDLQPDGAHPNYVGHELIQACVDPYLREVFGY